MSLRDKHYNEVVKEEELVLGECENFKLNLTYYSHRVEYVVKEENNMEEEDYLTGQIKWDSCMDMNIGYHHFCGFHNIVDFVKVLETIYNKAKNYFEVNDMDADMYDEWNIKEFE